MKEDFGFSSDGRSGSCPCATAGLPSRAGVWTRFDAQKDDEPDPTGDRMDRRDDTAINGSDSSLPHGWTSQPWHTGRAGDGSSSDTEGPIAQPDESVSANCRRSKLVAPRMTARTGS